MTLPKWTQVGMCLCGSCSKPGCMLQTGSQLGLASGLSLSTSSEAPRRLHNAPADPYVSHETEKMKVGLESLQADAGSIRYCMPSGTQSSHRTPCGRYMKRGSETHLSHFALLTPVAIGHSDTGVAWRAQRT